MSNTSSGSFTPYQYSGNSNGTFRKAGDYLKDFSKQSGANLGKVLGYKDTNEDASTATNRSTTDLRNGVRNSVASSSNVSKVLSGGSSKPPEKPAPTSTTTTATTTTTAKKPASTPAATSQPAELGEIDYARWAADSVANDPTSAAAGADAAYWENAYRTQYSANEKRKAMMASHQGPKTWDELASNAQARSGTGDARTRNTESIADYEAYTKYATAKQGVEDWEKASAKYRS